MGVWRAGLSTFSVEKILNFYQILQVVMVMMIILMIMITMMLVTMNLMMTRMMTMMMTMMMTRTYFNVIFSALLPLFLMLALNLYIIHDLRNIKVFQHNLQTYPNLKCSCVPLAQLKPGAMMTQNGGKLT